VTAASAKSLQAATYNLWASVSAGTDMLRHYDLNDLSRTAVESKSNRSCNPRINIAGRNTDVR